MTARAACSVVGALLALAAAGAAAQPLTIKDWVVACDNTRHCEAAGFTAEENDDGTPLPLKLRAALWLGRDAGPGTAVAARFEMQPPDGADLPKQVRLKLGPRVLRDVRPGQLLTPDEAKSLLPGLLDADAVTLAAGNLSWRVSLAGVKAALLKIDDMQGRLGTPGALVRKGSRDESTVPPPATAPRWKAAALPPPRAGDATLAGAILLAVKQRDCWDDLPDKDKPVVQVTRLSDTQLLLGRECWRGPYQNSTAFWIANAAPPHAPEPVAFPAPAGEEIINVVTGAEFSNSELSSFGKGRGVADCGEERRWAWTATGFVLTHAASAPLCRGIAGGVMVRTWTSLPDGATTSPPSAAPVHSPSR